jgi:hypothetical protein
MHHRWRISFETHPSKVDTPWALEDEQGERLYTRTLVIEAPCRTVLGQRNGRPSGYLETTGTLEYGEGYSIIRDQR